LVLVLVQVLLVLIIPSLLWSQLLALHLIPLLLLWLLCSHLRKLRQHLTFFCIKNLINLNDLMEKMI
jgi:hypothetical protein